MDLSLLEPALAQARQTLQKDQASLLLAQASLRRSEALAEPQVLPQAWAPLTDDMAFPQNTPENDSNEILTQVLMSTGGGHNGRNHPGLDVLGLADKRQWFRRLPVVELVLSEAVNVRRLIRTDSRQHLVGDFLALRLQPVNRFCHRNHVVESQQVGNQVVVLNEFALLISHIFGDHVVAAKRDPLYELVKPLALVRGRLNRLPQFGFGDVAQQEHGTNNVADFSEGEVQLVLA